MSRRRVGEDSPFGRLESVQAYGFVGSDTTLAVTLPDREAETDPTSAGFAVLVGRPGITLYCDSDRADLTRLRDVLSEALDADAQARS